MHLLAAFFNCSSTSPLPDTSGDNGFVEEPKRGSAISTWDLGNAEVDAGVDAGIVATSSGNSGGDVPASLEQKAGAKPQ